MCYMIRHMICHMNHFSTLVRHSSCIESYSSCRNCRNYRSYGSYGSYKLLRIPTNPTKCLSVSTACVYIRDSRPTASSDSILPKNVVPLPHATPIENLWALLKVETYRQFPDLE